LETIFHRARRRETLRLVQEVRGRGRYLDVGCGTAMITRLLPPGTVGVDLNPRNLHKAMHYAPRARFVLADAEGAIALRSGSFDVAICTEMLEHLLHPLKTVGEMHRLLTSAGVLLGSVPGRSPVWKLRWMSASRQAFAHEPYHKHYSRGDVERLLSRHFRIQTLYSKHLGLNWFFTAVKEVL
jgi:SAM-dependent methyltransferase